MKLDIGETLTLIANAAVVAGIAFLAFQIQEERKYAIVEDVIMVGNGLADWYDNVAHDPERADVLLRGSHDFHGLSQLEQYQFDLLMRSLIIRVEVGRLARSHGVAPKTSGPGGESLFLTGNYRRLLDLPGTREWWESMDMRGLPKGAIAYIDDYLDRSASGDSSRQ